MPSPPPATGVLPGAIQLLGVADDIEALTTAADVEESKPEPDLLGTTLDRLPGVEHAALVGDTVYDVQSAARAGLSCIGVRSGGISTAELLDAGAALVVDSLQDLIDLQWEDHLSCVRR